MGKTTPFPSVGCKESQDNFRHYFFPVNCSPDDKSKCKVSMKGAVWVFKSISHLEKTVESAELTLAPLESKLRARMNCRFSVSKTYSLPFLECEPLKANYDASHSKNGFTAQSKVLSEAALNFLSNQEEVTLLAERDAFVMKNYIDVYDPRNISGQLLQF